MKVIQKGFTLIEVMIVVAIIGVLAAIVSVNGVSLFKDAQIDSAAVAQNSMKQAVSAYVFKNKALPTSEAQMVTGGFIDASIVNSIKLGTGASATFNTVGNVAGEASAGNGFDLDGDGTVDTTAGDTVIQFVVTGVTPNEARDLSLALDGTANTPAVNALDAKGRVEYPIIASGATGSVTVYVDRR